MLKLFARVLQTHLRGLIPGLAKRHRVTLSPLFPLAGFALAILCTITCSHAAGASADDKRKADKKNKRKKAKPRKRKKKAKKKRARSHRVNQRILFSRPSIWWELGNFLPFSSGGELIGPVRTFKRDSKLTFARLLSRRTKVCDSVDFSLSGRRKYMYGLCRKTCGCKLRSRYGNACPEACVSTCMETYCPLFDKHGSCYKKSGGYRGGVKPKSFLATKCDALQQSPTKSSHDTLSKDVENECHNKCKALTGCKKKEAECTKLQANIAKQDKAFLASFICQSEAQKKTDKCKKANAALAAWRKAEQCQRQKKPGCAALEAQAIKESKALATSLDCKDPKQKSTDWCKKASAVEAAKTKAAQCKKDLAACQKAEQAVCKDSCEVLQELFDRKANRYKEWKPQCHFWLELYKSKIENKTPSASYKIKLRTKAIKGTPQQLRQVLGKVPFPQPPPKTLVYCYATIGLSKIIPDEANYLLHYRWIKLKPRRFPVRSGPKGVIPVGPDIRLISLDRFGNPLTAPPRINENHHVLITLTGPYNRYLGKIGYTINITGGPIQLKNNAILGNIHKASGENGAKAANGTTPSISGQESNNTWFLLGRIPGGYRYNLTIGSSTYTIGTPQASGTKAASKDAASKTTDDKQKSNGQASTKQPAQTPTKKEIYNQIVSFYVYQTYRFRLQLGAFASGFVGNNMQDPANPWNAPIRYGKQGNILTGYQEFWGVSPVLGFLLYIHPRDVYDPQKWWGGGVFFGMGLSEKIFQDYYLGLSLEIKGAIILTGGLRFLISRQTPNGAIPGTIYLGEVTPDALQPRLAMGLFLGVTFDPIVMVTVIGDYIQTRIAQWRGGQ